MKSLSIVLFQFGFIIPLLAQDLDPRAYARVPVNLSTISTGFSYSHGGVVTDPTLPVKDIKATLFSPSVGFVHSFSLFKLTSQALVAVPYSFAKVSGQVGEQQQSITRSGFSDLRLRLSVLIHGAPAANYEEVVKAPRKTVIGVSINMVMPTGQFYSDKLINLGANRFAFRPEVALSHPFKKRMLIDVYAGIWFFTDNNSFYPGNAIRSQAPMGTFQAHLSYNIRPTMWVALDATYYVGGTSSVNNYTNDDRQSNSRIGATAVMPIGKGSMIKFSYSTGAVVRVGQDFSSYSLGYQLSWMKKSPGDKHN